MSAVRKTPPASAIRRKPPHQTMRALWDGRVRFAVRRFLARGASDGTACDHRPRGSATASSAIGQIAACDDGVVDGWDNRGADKRELVMHRTNWTAAQTQVNLPVPAVRTRHSRVPLIWTVPDRIALMQRNTAIFGKDSIAMLLADRGFIGEDCSNYLEKNDIPFPIRVAHNRLVTRGLPLPGDACDPDHPLQARAALDRNPRRHGARPALRLPQAKGRRLVITATNRAGQDALATTRWPRSPAPKNPLTSRKVQLPHRLYGLAKRLAIRAPQNPHRMDQPSKTLKNAGVVKCEEIPNVRDQPVEFTCDPETVHRGQISCSPPHSLRASRSG